jgi:Tol biopolymer transport system component
VVARGAFTNLAIAPDGKRVAVDRADTYPRSIWTIELARGAATKRITFDFFSYLPFWSGDGARLVYGGAKSGPPNIYTSRVDQVGADERKTETALLEFPTDWTSDDRYILFTRDDPKTGKDIWLLPLADNEPPRPIVKTAFSDSEARVAPDRKWMAYTSTESGIPEVYVTDFPEARERHLVSANGGSLPVWRRNSSELYYRSGGKIMAVAIGPDAEFEYSPPILLFEASSMPEDAAVFDVAPDGRFLLNRFVSRTSPTLTVVSDWRGGLVR